MYRPAVQLLVIVVVSGSGSGQDIPEDCHPPAEVVSGLQKTEAALASCVINHTAPSAFCRLCKPPYDEFENFYSVNVSEDCQDFSAFKQIHNFYENLWSSSGCNACDLASMEMMQNRLDKLQTCMNTSSNSTNPVSSTTYHSGTSMCTKCKSQFDEIRNFYQQHLSHGCRGTQDIIDAYRRGLAVWSSEHCTKSHKAQVPAEATLGTFFALIVAFYAGSYIFGKNNHDDRKSSESTPAFFSENPTTVSGDTPTLAPVLPEVYKQQEPSTPWPVPNRPRAMTTPAAMTDPDLQSIGSNSKFSYKYESFSTHPFTPDKPDNPQKN